MPQMSCSILCISSNQMIADVRVSSSFERPEMYNGRKVNGHLKTLICLKKGINKQSNCSSLLRLVLICPKCCGRKNYLSSVLSSPLEKHHSFLVAALHGLKKTETGLYSTAKAREVPEREITEEMTSRFTSSNVLC